MNTNGKDALAAWQAEVLMASWQNFSEVKRHYISKSIGRDQVEFNVGMHQVITRVDYQRQTLMILNVNSKLNRSTRNKEL